MSEHVRFRVPEPTIVPVIYSQGNWLLLYYFVLLCIGWVVFCKGMQILRSPPASNKEIKDLEERLVQRMDVGDERIGKSHLQSTRDATEEVLAIFSKHTEDLNGHRVATRKAYANVEKQLTKQSSDNRKAQSAFMEDIQRNFDTKLTQEVDIIKATVRSTLQQDQTAAKTEVSKAFNDVQTRVDEAFKKNNAEFATKLEEQEQRGTDVLDLPKSLNATALYEALKENKIDFATKLDEQEKWILEVNKSQATEALRNQEDRHKEQITKQKSDLECELEEQEKRTNNAITTHKSQTTTAFQEQEDRQQKQNAKQKLEFKALLQQQQEQFYKGMQDALAKQKFELKSQFREQETRNKEAFDAHASEIVQLRTVIGTFEAHKDATRKKSEEQGTHLHALEIGLKGTQSKLQKVPSLEARLATQETEGKEWKSINNQLKIEMKKLQKSTATKEQIEEQKQQVLGVQTQLTTMKTQIANLQEQQDDAVTKAITDRETSQQHLENNKKQSNEKVVKLTKKFSELKSGLQGQETGLANLKETQNTEDQVGEPKQKLSSSETDIGTHNKVITKLQTDNSELLRKTFEFVDKKTFDEQNQKLEFDYKDSLKKNGSDAEKKIADLVRKITDLQSASEKPGCKCDDFKLAIHDLAAKLEITSCELDRKSSSINKDVEELGGKIERLVSTLTARIQEQDQKSSENAKKVDSVNKSLAGFQAEVTTLTANFKQQDQKVSGVEKAVTSIELGFVNVNSQLKALHTNVDEQGHEMSITELSLKELSEEVEQISSTVSTIDEQEKKITGMKQDVTAFMEIVTHCNNQAATLTSTVVEHGSQISNTETTVKSLRAHVDQIASTFSDGLEQRKKKCSHIEEHVKTVLGNFTAFKEQADQQLQRLATQAQEDREATPESTDGLWQAIEGLRTDTFDMVKKYFTEEIPKHQVTLPNNDVTANDLATLNRDLEKKTETLCGTILEKMLKGNDMKTKDLEKAILAHCDAKFSSADTKISSVEADTKALRLEQYEGVAKLARTFEGHIKIVQNQLDVLKGHPHPQASHHSPPKPFSGQQRTPQHSSSPQNMHQRAGFPPNMTPPFVRQQNISQQFGPPMTPPFVPQQNMPPQTGFQQNMPPQHVFQPPPFGFPPPSPGRRF
ncbi:hypothetical protein PMIN07_007391 [Paraphaeosphaeria minitans]